MLTGESSFFAILLVSLSLALAWLYWRENRRARGMQAFFASVTHELRTPLTSMRLQAEAIAEGDQRAELAQRLLQDSYRLESQIDKTLELARIEGGGPLSEQAIPLRGWLEQVIAKCAESHGRALEYVVRIPPALPAVSADAAAVQMILRNLIENSVRHSGRQPVHVELSARADDGGVVVDYSDDGSGLKLHGDPRLVGRLFGRGQTSNGTGVGLYLVRALMQRMGGKLQLGATAAGGFHASLWFAATIEN
jgi:signal transduction histidine kinase